jgi:histidyl-tRNA synthetase
MGKYGDEGDKLLFKVLNSGDFMSNVDDALLAEKDSVKITNKISEKGLRYDLTVPFARFVVQNRNELVFPFKRYQIQPVWRADRPQKGRYREFYQCDVDVIGSDSLLNEVELIQIVNEVYRQLSINVTLKINNRKILAGIAETIGQADRIIDITVAIDKLDKIGLEKVNQELLAKGIPAESIEKLQPILALSGSNAEKLTQIEAVVSQSEIGLKGIEEMRTIFSYLDSLDMTISVELDLTLARGLNYYTGAIFEVKANDVQIGSITGGGRYDDLTGVFGLPGVSGVGISFGADRIYDVMDHLNLFPDSAIASTKVLFVNFGKAEENYVLPVLSKLRSAGISCEIYPEAAKMKKQMEYANRKNIPFVVLAGESEIQSGKLTLKNMETGEQKLVSINELINLLINF